jgi:DoxX-like family
MPATTQASGFVQSATQAAPVSTKKLWAGRIMSGLVVLFLAFDAILKFFKPAPVAEAFAHVGWPMALANTLGALLLVCTALYAFPATSILGGILLTGYLGGAVATHLRAGDPLFSHVLFPTYLGLLLWGGLYLREARLRALLPLRS